MWFYQLAKYIYLCVNWPFVMWFYQHAKYIYLIIKDRSIDCDIPHWDTHNCQWQISQSLFKSKGRIIKYLYVDNNYTSFYME